VQQTRYTANFPIAYLVHGSLTYVSVLKDAAGNSRMVGMVSALDRSVVAVGDNLEHVTRVYLSALRGSSVRTAALAPEAAPRTVSGTLVRSGSYVLEGRSFVLVRLQVGEATRDYTVDIGPASLRQIVLAQPGDGVELQVLASDAGGDEIRAVTVTPKP